MRKFNLTQAGLSIFIIFSRPIAIAGAYEDLMKKYGNPPTGQKQLEETHQKNTQASKSDAKLNSKQNPQLKDNNQTKLAESKPKITAKQDLANNKSSIPQARSPQSESKPKIDNFQNQSKSETPKIKNLPRETHEHTRAIQPATPQKKSEPSYTLQLFAVEKMEDAIAKMVAIQDNGHQAICSSAIVKNHEWLRVSVGKFSTTRGAREFAQKHFPQSNYFINYFPNTYCTNNQSKNDCRINNSNLAGTDANEIN